MLAWMRTARVQKPAPFLIVAKWPIARAKRLVISGRNRDRVKSLHKPSYRRAVQLKPGEAQHPAPLVFRRANKPTVVDAGWVMS
jgi:hypothetical protein